MAQGTPHGRSLATRLNIGTCAVVGIVWILLGVLLGVWWYAAVGLLLLLLAAYGVLRRRRVARALAARS